MIAIYFRKSLPSWPKTLKSNLSEPLFQTVPEYLWTVFFYFCKLPIGRARRIKHLNLSGTYMWKQWNAYWQIGQRTGNLDVQRSINTATCSLLYPFLPVLICWWIASGVSSPYIAVCYCIWSYILHWGRNICPVLVFILEDVGRVISFSSLAQRNRPHVQKAIILSGTGFLGSCFVHLREITVPYEICVTGQAVLSLTERTGHSDALMTCRWIYTPLV